MFAVFTPMAWPAGSPVHVADPSGRTCIVSLLNKHGRPFRLKLKSGQEPNAVYKYDACGPCFGDGGGEVAVFAEKRCSCLPGTFELDAEAERKAGLPSLPFAYDRTLLSGVDEAGQSQHFFELAELECYTLDA